MRDFPDVPARGRRQDFPIGSADGEWREPAMNQHTNAAAIAEMREIFNRGDMGEFLARISDDVVAHVAGNNRIWGTYQGKAEYAAYLGRLGEWTGGDLRVELKDILASDSHAMVVLKGVGSRASDGKPLDVEMAYAVRFDPERRWKEMWFLASEQAAWDDFWS
jgi:hypothetical protein